MYSDDIFQFNERSNNLSKCSPFAAQKSVTKDAMNHVEFEGQKELFLAPKGHFYLTFASVLLLFETFQKVFFFFSTSKWANPDT